MESLETKTQLITLAQAAKRTGYTPEYLNSLSRQGILLAQKIGRNWFVDEKHLQSFEAWIHSSSYPKPGRKKNHAEPAKLAEPTETVKPAETAETIPAVQMEQTAPEKSVEIIPKFKLPIFKERIMRFAFTFLLFWGVSVGFAYLFAHGQTKITSEKKSSPIFSQNQVFNPQDFSKNYQEKVREVLSALNLPRSNLSLELNQKYFPDNSNASELLAQNDPKQPEPKIAGAEKTVASQAEIKVSPLSQDAWKFLFLIGSALIAAALIFWFFYSIHKVFLQPVGTFGWIILLIFFLASSLTLNQFIRRTVEPGINETQFNPFKPSTAGKPSVSNSKNGVQISGEKQTQEALVTAGELNSRLLDYVLKDSLKKNQMLAGDVYLNWAEKLKLAKDSVKSTEIARHAIEAEDIDTGSITSRTIRNYTIQGEDINPETDITVDDILSDQIIAETLIINDEATIPILNITDLIDFGANTIADGNFVGDWNFNGGDLTTTGNIIAGTLNVGATTLSGNLDMANNIIQNIGDAGTDFTATGGLNLAGNLDVNGLVNDIAGTLNLSGNALTSSGLLTITPALGLTVNTNGPLILNAAGQSVTLTGAATIFNTSTFYLNNTGAISIGTNGSEQNITFETANFDVNATGTVTIDGTNFTYTPTGTYTITLADNLANALDIQEGANNYLNINTSNTTEAMQFGNAITNPSFSFLGTGLVTANNFGSSSVAITGGTINGTTIGVVTPAAGNFTSIGITTPGTGAFTTLTSSGNTTLGTGAAGVHTYSTGAGSTTTLGNSTGALTIASGGTSSWTNTSGNLTIATATSGTLALTSAGALNLTALSASTNNITGTYLINSSDVLSLNTTSNAAITTGTGLATFNGNAILGTNSANTLAINSVIASDVIPEGNARDFGSDSNRWEYGYFTNIDATNISGVIVTGSTASNSWTINSDNVTNNAEIASLVFRTGTLAPINAVLQWNAANDPSKVIGFDNSNLFNFPIAIYSKVNGINQTFTSGSLFKFSQPATDPITQSGAFIGANIDFSSNLTVPNNASGNQTGFLATLKDGGASATAIGFQTAGTLDYGLDIGGTIGTADIRLSNAATIVNNVNGTLALTEPTIQLIGSTAIDIDSPLVTISGLAENATALEITAGDLVLTDGDLTLVSGDFSFTGATGLISLSSTLGITALGTTLDATTLSIDSTDTTNLTMTANAAGDKTLTIAATNGGAGAGLINMSADGDINIDTSAGTLYLNNTNNRPVTFGAGLTTLGGNLTVTGTTWTATPTISGLVTLTSGFDSNSASTVAGLTVDTNGNLAVSNGTFTTAGGIVNINDSSNFATNINTGTSTGAVAIGNALADVAITSNDWAISSAGAATGFASYNGLIITANTGAITTGSWHGTVIDADHGGTGQTVYAVGDLLYASTTTALSKLADVAVGSVLISGGVNTAPGWGTIGASGITANSLDFTEFQNTLDLDANLILNQTAYTWTQNFTGDTTTGLTYNANSLTTGTAVSLASTSTAGGASGSSYLLNLARSGANASASHSAYGIYSNVINTGATSTNIAGYFSASGATNNQSLYVDSAVAGANNYTIYANGAAKNFFAGNIGIGLTAPGEKLSVNGNVMIGDATWAAGTTTGDLAIQGNVGIGTTGPISKLHVYSQDSPAPNYYAGQLQVGGSYGVVNDINLSMGIDYTSDKVFLQGWNGGVGSADMLLQPNGGNVGIGTTTPGAKLDVDGLIISRSNSSPYQWYNGSSLQFLVGAGNSFLGLSNADTVLYGVTGKLILESAGVAGLTVDTTGNVGIGTTNPTLAMLQVAGDIYTTGNMSALSITDRTAYPKDLAQAYAAVTSMQRLPDGLYDANNSEMQLDHTKLSPFIKSASGERDLSASVSSINEVTKYILSSLGGLAGVGELSGKVASATADLNALGSSFYITNSSGSVIFSGSREISAQPSREIALTASSIILDGNVSVTGNSLIVGGINLLEKTEENSLNIGSLSNNQNKIVEQLTGKLDSTSLTLSDKLRIIGENLDNLNSEQYTKKIKKIKDQIEDNTLAIESLTADASLLDVRLGILETAFDIVGNNVNIFGDLTVNDITANNLTLSGKLEVDGIVAGVMTVKVVDPERKTIGDAVICAAGKIFKAASCVDVDPLSEEIASDGKTIEIQTKAVSNTAKIFTSFANNPGAYSWVEKIQDAGGNYTGFQIKLSAPVLEKTQVSWWIVEAE